MTLSSNFQVLVRFLSCFCSKPLGRFVNARTHTHRLLLHTVELLSLSPFSFSFINLNTRIYANTSRFTRTHWHRSKWPHTHFDFTTSKHTHTHAHAQLLTCNHSHTSSSTHALTLILSHTYSLTHAHTHTRWLTDGHIHATKRSALQLFFSSLVILSQKMIPHQSFSAHKQKLCLQWFNDSSFT